MARIDIRDRHLVGERAEVNDKVVMHLVYNETYDETEVWCSSASNEHSRVIEETTCMECLQLAQEYGERARRRLSEVLSKEARR